MPTRVEVYLMSALTELERYRDELPECAEKHRVKRAISQLKRTLVFYAVTYHADVNPHSLSVSPDADNSKSG